MHDKPDFSSYSHSELLDVKEHIDKEAYPDRYAEIVNLLSATAHPAKAPDNEKEEHEINKYSTFWPRFFAAAIDGVVFAFILYFECLIFGIEYDAQDKFLQAINGVQFAVYAIFMHGFFGQTLGKMVMGVKVLNHDTETQINVLQALRRESVNLALNIVWVFLSLTVAVSLESHGAISENLALVVIGFGLLAFVWAVSEFVTMLFNDKRRAIHDFIGKTVVVRI
ncbi:RDD family protein [Alishewanella longhuensis]